MGQTSKTTNKPSQVVILYECASKLQGLSRQHGDSVIRAYIAGSLHPSLDSQGRYHRQRKVGGRAHTVGGCEPRDEAHVTSRVKQRRNPESPSCSVHKFACQLHLGMDSFNEHDPIQVPHFNHLGSCSRRHDPDEHEPSSQIQAIQVLGSRTALPSALALLLPGAPPGLRLGSWFLSRFT